MVITEFTVRVQSESGFLQYAQVQVVLIREELLLGYNIITEKNKEHC